MNILIDDEGKDIQIVFDLDNRYTEFVNRMWYATIESEVIDVNHKYIQHMFLFKDECEKKIIVDAYNEYTKKEVVSQTKARLINVWNVIKDIENTIYSIDFVYHNNSDLRIVINKEVINGVHVITLPNEITYLCEGDISIKAFKDLIRDKLKEFDNDN